MLTLLFALACAPTAETATTAEDWCYVFERELCEECPEGFGAESTDVSCDPVGDDCAASVEAKTDRVSEEQAAAFYQCMAENPCTDEWDACDSILTDP